MYPLINDREPARSPWPEKPAPASPPADRPEKATPYLPVLRRYNVPERYYADFVEFVETGDVSDELSGFIAYFESSSACQDAVEQAFAMRVGRLQEVIRLLNGD